MEDTEIGFGNDWCTLNVAEHCREEVPSKCILLGDQVRACRSCLRELLDEEFSEDFHWKLNEFANHDDGCQKVDLDFKYYGQEKEVTFCPLCLREVLLKHDVKAFDWVLPSHNDTHSEPKSGMNGDEEHPKACRECLLLALHNIDWHFYELIVTKKGRDFIENQLG